MAGFLLLLPLLVVLAVLVPVLARRAPLPVPQRLHAIARSTRRWRLAGVLTGLAAAVATAAAGALGRGPLLAAPTLGLCALLGVVAGERGVRAPAGPARSATMEVRRPRDYLPPVLSSAVGAATVLLAGLLAFTSATGSSDDQGRAGRSLARACSDVVTQGLGPWPGSFYAWPLAVALLAGLVVGGVALIAVTCRPRQGEDPTVDDALRRQAATGVVAALGLLVAAPLVGVGVLAARGLLRICNAPGSWTAVGAVLLAVVPLALGVAIWCASVLVAPLRAHVADPLRA